MFLIPGSIIETLPDLSFEQMQEVIELGVFLSMNLSAIYHAQPASKYVHAAIISIV